MPNLPEKIGKYPVIGLTGRGNMGVVASGDELVLSRVRKIQADARQICNDAADIEDARFLAEKVIDTCRRILAAGSGTMANAQPINGLQSKHPGVAVRASEATSEPSSEATARAKLDSLSARELEIFTHLAEGSSAAEIAVRLSRSSKTINNQRTRILHKLGVKNATELVRLALQSGLVSV